MQKRKYLKKAVTVLLLFVLSAALFTTASLAANGNDYSKPGTVAKLELDTPTILSLILGEEIVGIERDYLELYGDFKISHIANIPTGGITVREESAEGKLYVKAAPYSYTAENGALVTFIPEGVRINGNSINFADDGMGGFILSVDSSLCDGEEKIRVIYSTEIEISTEEANALINKAYYDAAEWKRIISDKEFEYVKAKAQYIENCELYEDYIAALAEYKTAKELYDKYVSDKSAYDRRLAEYNEYLEELSVYDKDLAAHKEYLEALKKYDEDLAKYKEYLYVKENYDTLLAKYDKYVRDMEAVRYQLSIIDGTKNKSTALKRSIYSAVVIGNTVTTVIENKDAIANGAVGVAPEVVDLAGDSTENIRQLCKDYFKLQTESEKYAYFLVNYEGFRSSFTSLFISLDKLYTNSKVRALLRERDMQEKYEILLGQLYYTVNALNEGEVYNYDKTAVYDSKYVINTLTKKTPLAILDNVPYIVDREGLATPVSTGYPTEVKKPSDTEVAEPTLPKFVPEPAEPYPVEEPGTAPIEVTEPSKPKEVNAPGEEPVPYIPDQMVKDLIVAFENGVVTRRNEVVSAVKIEHKIEVLKTLGDAELVKVEFMNSDGSRICSPVFVEKGTYADFPGQTPKKESDAEAHYEFAYWVNSLGERCDLECVNSDLILYPYFKKQTKSYIIGWKIDNFLVEDTVLYGEIPTPPESPTKASDGKYEYVFEGWDREILAVDSDAVYRAKFKQIPIFSAQNGSAATVQKDENGYTVDCGDSWDYEFNLSKLFTLISEDDFITVKSANASFTLTPEAIAEIEALGAVGIRVNTEIISTGYTITVVPLYDGTAMGYSAALSSDIRLTLSKALSFEDSSAVRLYYIEDGRRRLVKTSYEDGILTSSFIVGKKYYAAEEYSINSLSSDEIKITVPEVAKKGERVRVEISSLPEWATLDLVYYLDSSGNKIAIENFEFIMPAQNVILGVEYHIPTYTVTFIADGKVILSTKYSPGEKVNVPAVPGKASDTKYYYTHGFWTPTVTDVTSDATYEAKYVPHEIIREEKTGLQISDELKDILAKAILIVFSAFVVGLVIFLTVWIVRRRMY